jgi:hypothetical protein
MFNFYFKGMTLQQIREELNELGIVLSDAEFNALTYAELNTIGSKAYKVYKLNREIGNIVGHADDKLAPPLESDNIPSTPPGEFR